MTKKIEEIVEEVKEIVRIPVKKEPEVSWRKVVSTGSTLLDLAISGKRVRGGGLPGGIIAEVSGIPSSGKTTIMAETAGNVQRLGGEYELNDPETRLTPEYCQQMGVIFDKEHYHQPDTVTEIFDNLIGPIVTVRGKEKRDTDNAWKPNPEFINLYGNDSLAALSTRMEMEQGDKMGQRRAKEFSEGLRLSARHIHKHNILFFCTNQIRDNVDARAFQKQTSTPGGWAIPFYSSVRIELKIISIMKDTAKVRSIEHEKKIGIEILATVTKNSLDSPFRQAPIFIIFNYGIDDIRANLLWLKENGGFPLEEGEKKLAYKINDKKFIGLEQAIKYVEENQLENQIKEQVINLWEEIETHFDSGRVKRRD